MKTKKIQLYFKQQGREKEFTIGGYDTAVEFEKCCKNTTPKKIERAKTEYIRVVVDTPEYKLNKTYTNIYSIRKVATKLVSLGL